MILTKSSLATLKASQNIEAIALLQPILFIKIVISATQ